MFEPFGHTPSSSIRVNWVDSLVNWVIASTLESVKVGSVFAGNFPLIFRHWSFDPPLNGNRITHNSPICEKRHVRHCLNTFSGGVVWHGPALKVCMCKTSCGKNMLRPYNQTMPVLRTEAVAISSWYICHHPINSKVNPVFW